MTENSSPQPAHAHTPGPWTVEHDGPNRKWLVNAEEFGVATCDGAFKNQAANARLIAAAPDYHDAAFWIRQAVANNAAPVNPLAALEEMALDGEHVTLDAGLVLDLLKAHARATGAQA